MNKKIKIIGILILSFGMTLYFVSKMNFSAFFNSIKEASLLWIFVAFLLFLIQVVIRMLRFKLLLKIDPSFQGEMIHIQSVYSILKYLFPALLGELSILFLFKKKMGIDYARSSQALFIIRIIDFVFFSLLFLVFFFFFYGGFFSGSELVQKVTQGMIILIAGCLTFLSIIAIGRKKITKWIENHHFQNNRFGQILTHFAKRFLFHFYQSLSFRSILFLSSYTLLLWMFLYFYFVACVRAIHVELSLSEILFIYLLLWPINVLPIKGPGNFGTHELGWVLSLIILGYNQTQAVLIAFGTHTIFIATLLILLSILLVIYGKRTFFTGSLTHIMKS